MEEKEAIQDIIKSRQEAMCFFSNADRLKREEWVVHEFLKNIGITFNESELKPGNNPPDIVFRNAEFEIKEVDAEGRKRHDEYKRKLEQAKATTSLKALMTPLEFKEIALQEIVNRIQKELKEFVYATDFCKNIDILFYINYSLIGEHDYIISEKHIWEKWRSVSMITNNNISLVFWANDDAQEFIKSIAGKLIRRNIQI